MTVAMNIAKSKNRKLTKSLNLTIANFDKENRSLELSFSSITPIKRWADTYEVLVHEDSAIDFSRLNNSAALLYNHNHNKQIGVVESAWLDADKCRAKVKFSKNAEAAEIFQDINDGIIKNVSVGYQVLDEEYNEKSKTVIVKSWQPYEISIVTVPADVTVGIGRSQNKVENFNHDKGENTMSEKNNTIDNQQADLVQAERSRIAAIQGIADEHNFREISSEHITKGTSANAFRTIVLDSLAARNKQKLTVLESSNPQINTARSGHSRVENNHTNEGFVGAIRRLQESPSGASLKLSQDTLERSIITADNGAIIPTTLKSDSFIKMLHNKSIVINLVKKLYGLQGNFDIPKQTASSDVFWVGEKEKYSEGKYKTDKNSMTGKKCAVQLSISEELLINSTPSVELAIKEDIATKMALAIDKAVLYGTGDKQPLGLLSTSGVQNLNLTAAPTLANYVKLETLISQQNADVANMRYLLNPALRGLAKTTAKNMNATSDSMIWEVGNTINGYGVGVSNQVLANQIIFGDFNQIILGFWDGLSLTVDPYTESNEGSIRITARQIVDVAILRPESFAVAKITELES